MKKRLIPLLLLLLFVPTSFGQDGGPCVCYDTCTVAFNSFTCQGNPVKFPDTNYGHDQCWIALGLTGGTYYSPGRVIVGSGGTYTVVEWVHYCLTGENRPEYDWWDDGPVLFGCAEFEDGICTPCATLCPESEKYWAPNWGTFVGITGVQSWQTPRGAFCKMKEEVCSW